MDESYFIWAKSIIGHDFKFDEQRGRKANKIFRLTWSNGDAFLKVCDNLIQEKQKLEWIDERLPVPKVLGFKKGENEDYLLLSTIEGEDLAYFIDKWDHGIITSKLAHELLEFHKTNISDWPFSKVIDGDVLLHGDVALPNLIYKIDGAFSGYIDLGDLKVGDRERDLIDAVWTLQRNLGRGYGLQFLQQYGVSDANEKMVDELHSKY